MKGRGVQVYEGDGDAIGAVDRTNGWCTTEDGVHLRWKWTVANDYRSKRPFECLIITYSMRHPYFRKQRLSGLFTARADAIGPPWSIDGENFIHLNREQLIVMMTQIAGGHAAGLVAKAKELAEARDHRWTKP